MFSEHSRILEDLEVLNRVVVNEDFLIFGGRTPGIRLGVPYLNVEIGSELP